MLNVALSTYGWLCHRKQESRGVSTTLFDFFPMNRRSVVLVLVLKKVLFTILTAVFAVSTFRTALMCNSYSVFYGCQFLSEKRVVDLV